MRTKKAGRGTGRKFTSKDLAPAALPASPSRPFVALLMRSQARCPEWRDTQRAARHRNYSGQSSLHAEAGAQSSTQYRQRDATVAAGGTEDRYERKRRSGTAAVKCPRRPRESSTRCPHDDDDDGDDIPIAVIEQCYDTQQLLSTKRGSRLITTYAYTRARINFLKRSCAQGEKPCIHFSTSLCQRAELLHEQSPLVY